jgi:glycosyltransferase involved in cell wall biosynthesis
MYPPHHQGGYEIHCEHMVSHLRASGHDVRVLTSSRGLGGPRTDGPVLRWLRVRMPDEPIPHGRVAELGWHAWNRLALALTIRRVKPDVVLVFNSSGLGATIVHRLHLRSRGALILHDVCDLYLLGVYRDDIWFSLRDARLNGWRRVLRLPLLLLGGPIWGGAPARLDLRRSLFRSYWLRESYEGVPHIEVGDAPVVYHGTALVQGDLAASPEGPPSVFYAGRLVPDKGAHVLLEAMSILGDHAPSATLVGPSVDPQYEQLLNSLADGANPPLDVRFLGRLPHEETLALMAKHTIFVFPVLWEEPSGRTLGEALSAGLAVVSTATGGAAELVRDGQNALVVPPGDAQALAGALRRLIVDPALRVRLGAAARATAQDHAEDSLLVVAEEHIASSLARRDSPDA